MEKLFKKTFIDNSYNYSKKLVDSLNYSVSHYQAVELCSNNLKKAGFNYLNESENWKLKPGHKYFFTRNQSALIAFTVGSKINLNNTKFKIIGTHTDSPNLRLAPNCLKKNGLCEKLNLERYGGGQWQTWFDRDLSVCGKILYNDENNNIKTKIVRINEPLFNIPSLAIHLVSGSNKPYDWNNETHLKAIMSMGLGIETEKEDNKDDINNESKNKQTSKTSELDKKLGSKLTELLSKNAGINKEQLLDFDLVLYDVQPSTIFGVNNEFISSGRLDNLGSTLVANDAIIESSNNIENQDFINVVAMFDNEEVGSTSFQGADNDLFAKTLERIFNTIETNSNNLNKDSFLTAVNKSFVISADLAHSTHPNYEEKHQSSHKVDMHSGVVIKINAMLRYATDKEGGYIIKDVCKKANVPYVEFIVRQDSPCGSTIGPYLSSHLGIKTVDIGVGIWAMHSIRETGSAVDFYHYYLFMKEFFDDSRESYNSGV